MFKINGCVTTKILESYFRRNVFIQKLEMKIIILKNYFQLSKN